MAHQSPALDDVFHALSDPTRRAIVVRLSERPASVSELLAPLQMAMPSLLKHLRVLEHSGLVATSKSGRVRTCQLQPDALATTETFLQHLRAAWSARLDRMDDYAATLHTRESKHAKRKR